MKILYTNFHAGDGGGHTTYILTLAAALAERHHVTVAAPGSSRLYSSAKEIPGVEAIALEFRNRLGAMVGMHTFPLNVILEKIINRFPETNDFKKDFTSGDRCCV